MSRHLSALMPGISEAFTETRLNDLVSEVDVTKYQHGAWSRDDHPAMRLPGACSGQRTWQHAVPSQKGALKFGGPLIRPGPSRPQLPMIGTNCSAGTTRLKKSSIGTKIKICWVESNLTTGMKKCSIGTNYYIRTNGGKCFIATSRRERKKSKIVP